MLSIEQYRRLLGAKAEGMTDEEIGRLRGTFYAFADSLTDRFIENNLSEKSKTDPPRDT